MCGNSVSKALLAEAKWYPYWDREDGACPACVQQNLLQILLAKGDAALHEAIQAAWPLDAEAAFGVLPTRIRLHADPRFSGKGITIALADAGFYPHPDLDSREIAFVFGPTPPIVLCLYSTLSRRKRRTGPIGTVRAIGSGTAR